MVNSRILADITTTALERGLSGVYARQRAIAENLANIETPGYKAKAVRFEASLSRAIAAERKFKTPGHYNRQSLDMIRPTVEYKDVPWRRDGNTVDLEAQMVCMAKSSLQYKLLSRLLSKKMQMMRRVINGGSKA